MEKYAIDLEKVLDDFEYREKQSHKYSPEQRDSFGSNYNVNDSIFPRHHKSPASNYRRPPFEPMNLADADFSVSTKPSSCLQTEASTIGHSVDSRSFVPPSPPLPQLSCPLPLSSSNDDDDDDDDDFLATKAAAAKYDYELKLERDTAQIDSSFPSSEANARDYAPDLIESNRDLCSNLNKFGLIERHLPDVASANVASADQLDSDRSRIVNESCRSTSAIDVRPMMDGRTDSVAHSSCAVFDKESTAVEKTTAMCTALKNVEKVVSFQMSYDVTDHALKQYLEELEETEDSSRCNEHAATNTSSDITEDCSDSTTADVDDEAINDTECSSSSSSHSSSGVVGSGGVCENFDERQFSNGSENDNRDYRMLSDNVLLISSSVDSQENLDSDLGSHNDNDDDDHHHHDAFNENDNENVNENTNKLKEQQIASDLNVQMHRVRVSDENDENVNGINEKIIESQPIESFQSSSAELECSRDRVLPNERPLLEISNATLTLIEYDATTPLSCASRTNNFSNETGNLNEYSAQKDVFTDAAASGAENASVDDVVAESSRSTLPPPPPPPPSTASLNASRSSCNDTASNVRPKLAFETLDSRTAILNFDSKPHPHQVVLESSTASAAAHQEQTPQPLSSHHLASTSQGFERHNQNTPNVDSAGPNFDSSMEDSIAVDEESLLKPQRPDSLNLLYTTQNNDMSSTSADSGSLLSVEDRKLGKEAPYWVPDSDTTVCMLCQMKFNPVIRRRHHCRACGMVVCAKCSDKKASLEYLGFKEDRVCHTCHSILQKVNSAESEITSVVKRPNPNNPMEYCSTIPPLLQVGSTHHPTPSVLVPKVGVLKREGRVKTNDTPKQVIFSDGIRPGGDLTESYVTSEPKLPLRRPSRITKRVGTPPAGTAINRRLLNADTRSFIPSGADLPPMVNRVQGECIFSELEKVISTETEAVKFAINRNLFVVVKRLSLDCCVHKEVWCITTEGMSCVGQDELVFILEVTVDEKHPPKDIFSTINVLYQEASKGSTVTEMSFVPPCNNQLFGCKEHGGFIFIRATYQCMQKLLLPKPPFLIGLLIHRWETPWARLFPIRLVLRLGAEYRYYPCPLVSVRNRAALYSEIGHTIFTLLADFRKYTYTLPTVRGLMIHMEDRLTTILLPRNRYDQVIRALNNSEENVLAFAGNISTIADSHLVCIQSIQQEDTTYHTQAINILNKPRQVTGASFIVFNGSLKQYGWSGKSNIVEDGLMVQIPSESMTALRSALRHMKNYSIGCGPQAEEMVTLKWAPDDVNFNIGVKSEVDNRPLDGVPSIRVHNGIDYSGTLRLIRWTEVFILQSEDESNNRTGDSINISKLAESIAKATCIALVPLLDLLATANLTTLAVRATIHPENVGYEAGSRGEKLPPIYMKSLDEELIAVIHESALSIPDVLNPILLELIFKIMEQG